MQKKIKILNIIGEKFTPKARGVLDDAVSIEYKTPTQTELAGLIGKYDGVIVGLEVKFDKAVLEKAKKLKFIATATTGLDHIDTAFAEKKGIHILSLKGENAFLDTVTGTAELAFGLLLSLIRFIPKSFDSVKSDLWDRESFRGHSLYGKSLGIVGMGRLGKMIARYGKAFGMKIFFTDPDVSKQEFPEYEKLGFEELIKESDMVSIHVHLSHQTENMFNRQVFNDMKKSAYLVNTSRGKVVNEEDILSALKNKTIAGYATDVLTDETSFGNHIPENHPLVEYARDNTNLIIVPHIGGMTHESREATDIFMAQKIKDYIDSSSFSA